MIDPLLQWFLNLLTIAEWRAIVWLLMGTIAGTHTLKIVWRLSPFPGGGHGHVYLVSAAIAMAYAFAIWPDGSVPWWAAGTVAGPASNVAFKVLFALLKKYAPDAAAAMNADRRKVWGLPPSGTPEQRKQP